MSQPPTPYARQYNFAGWSANNPTTPHQGNKLDQEYNALLASVNATISRLGEIQRDDGSLRTSASSSASKGWVTFDGTGTSPTIKASFNVLSVSRVSAGVYLVTFSEAMPTAFYCWTGSARSSSSLPVSVFQDSTNNSQTTTSLTVVTADFSGKVNCPLVNIAVFG